MDVSVVQVNFLAARMVDPARMCTNSKGQLRTSNREQKTFSCSKGPTNLENSLGEPVVICKIDVINVK